MTATATQKLAEIHAAAAAPCTDVRRYEKFVVGECAAHQGDVYLICVDDEHPIGNPWGSRQVAVGATIGARHVAEGDVDVFDGKSAPPGVDTRFKNRVGPVVVAKGEWCLTHPEHQHHYLPAGRYQVLYQIDMTTLQPVAD